MSGTPVKTPEEYLRILYPSLFDPDDPDNLDEILDIAELSRPKCLPDKAGNIAVAYYAAYLIDEVNKGEAGGGAITSGILLSEKEGDIQKTYANPLTGGGGAALVSEAPKSAWEKWKRLYDLCARGSITTRIGQYLDG